MVRFSQRVERTVICHDDDVQAAVEADLLEAVHELTDDSVHPLEGLDHLEHRSTSHPLSMDTMPMNRYAGTNLVFHRAIITSFILCLW